MWGDPQTAQHLDETPGLVSILFQVTGPAHIPWQDPIWQEVLSHYNVWVHCSAETASAMQRACQNTITHAPRSSNLAALAQHVTVLLRQYVQQREETTTNTTDEEVAAFSHRISLVSKARALAGSLHLLSILTHAVIAEYRGTPKETVKRNDSFNRSSSALLGRRRRSMTSTATQDRLKDVFTYQSRADSQSNDVGNDLVQALLFFIMEQRHSSLFAELYDCVCLAKQLMLVLLSTQLYRPFASSFGTSSQEEQPELYHFWTPCIEQSNLTAVLLHSIVQRLPPPTKSIQYHHSYLIQQVAATVATKKVGPDGLYETHTMVQATSRQKKQESDSSSSSSKHAKNGRRKIQSPIFDATKGVLVFSSSILLLPFRLVSLALGLLGAGPDYKNGQNHGRRRRRTHANDVLWLTDSPLADLSTALLLVLVNGCRAHHQHTVRAELAQLSDNRWETSLPDLPSITNGSDDTLLGSFRSISSVPSTTGVNFEALFSSLGSTAHTEVGALWLYTLLQSSKAFSDSVVVRSDLDTLVLPLLRTLYFNTVSRLYTGSSTPFRSISQLYVTIILLLLFSQDASFGADAFRRVMVSTVPWYKERNLKDISLGSVVLLTLLRCLSFVLHRHNDAFLLSNCCAVLMNLSSSVQDLHDWAAMRLADCTITTMQRYVHLRASDPVKEEDLTTPTGMNGEAARTLLCVLKQALNAKHIQRNLHLVYALVYHQASFKQVFANKDCPFSKKETSRIQAVLTTATHIIENDGNARTAPKALQVLSDKVHLLEQAANEKRQKTEDFMFSYEEEADPEVFFVPYVWDVIVCVLTASSIEWKKDRIQLFPVALEDDPESSSNNDDFQNHSERQNGDSNGHTPHFAQDASDFV